MAGYINYICHTTIEIQLLICAKDKTLMTTTFQDDDGKVWERNINETWRSLAA